MGRRGEHGGRLGEDTDGGRVLIVRFGVLVRLAGQPHEETVLRLEEEEAAGQAGRDAEETGPGLNGVSAGCQWNEEVLPSAGRWRCCSLAVSGVPASALLPTVD